MDLSTTYLGFELPHPFIPGASPLSSNLDDVRRLEDAGAPMIVLESLFEEQLIGEELATVGAMEHLSQSYAEALNWFPDPEEFRLGPDDYLAHVRRVKAAVDVPVVGSLNGSSPGGWLQYATLIEEAGADALELNVYYVASDFELSGAAIEERTLEMVRAVKAAVSIPLAAKLSPFYTSTAHIAKRLDEAGVDGLVLFNRFYQADIDIEELEAVRTLNLSDSDELLLRLRWLAILAGRLNASLAATGGVHTAVDAVKALMCGAHAVKVVSALLRHGPAYLGALRDEVERWMEEHEYESVRQMQGSMSCLKCPDPSAFERANYMHILKSWRR